MSTQNDRLPMPMVPDWPGRKAGDAGHDRIAALIVLDIQNAPQWARRVLGEVEDVMSGASSGWEMAMNAHILTVGKTRCEIAASHDGPEEGACEDSISVQTGDLKAALVAWIAKMDRDA
ncbi:hypothetical protein ACTU44_03640 [Thalassospira sp. SM2505]